MILLEVQNRIIAQALQDRFEQVSGNEKVDPVNVTLSDFDGAEYHLSNLFEGESTVRTKILVSIRLRFWHELAEHGVLDLMKREYSDQLQATPEDGYNLTLLVDLNNMGADPHTTITRVASLRRNCYAAVLEKFFNLQKEKAIGEKAVLHYREKETIYINVLKDRVTVIFSTLFSDADDVVIGKVFMQAFKDVRSKNAQAPQVLFSHKDPPDELASTDALRGDNVGYVTFVLFPRHTEDGRKDQTIDLIHTFRDYLHYHIKCSKAYLHQRMRARTSSLLKVLNRARPDSEKKIRKTVTGKTLRTAPK